MIIIHTNLPGNTRITNIYSITDMNIEHLFYSRSGWYLIPVRTPPPPKRAVGSIHVQYFSRDIGVANVYLVRSTTYNSGSATPSPKNAYNNTWYVKVRSFVQNIKYIYVERTPLSGERGTLAIFFCFTLVPFWPGILTGNIIIVFTLM